MHSHLYERSDRQRRTVKAEFLEFWYSHTSNFPSHTCIIRYLSELVEWHLVSQSFILIGKENQARQWWNLPCFPMLDLPYAKIEKMKTHVLITFSPSIFHTRFPASCLGVTSVQVPKLLADVQAYTPDSLPRSSLLGGTGCSGWLRTPSYIPVPQEFTRQLSSPSHFEFYLLAQYEALRKR